MECSKTAILFWNFQNSPFILRLIGLIIFHCIYNLTCSSTNEISRISKNPTTVEPSSTALVQTTSSLATTLKQGKPIINFEKLTKQHDFLRYFVMTLPVIFFFELSLNRFIPWLPKACKVFCF